jgi:DNA modification methylase
MTVRILTGDVRQVLATVPDESVHCCITSPPYWGLRSYLPAGHPQKHLEIGSEPTVEQWVQTMVQVLREVRRVLRKDGTLWLNLGDSYAGSRRGGYSTPSKTLNGKQAMHSMVPSGRRDNHSVPRSDLHMPGHKPKDLVGQPWLLAFALRADGWWLRQEIIWDKNNAMPEAVKDRCTTAHEHIFLLSKSAKYYYDWKAIAEPVTGTAKPRGGGVNPKAKKTPSGWDTGPGSHRHMTGRYSGNGVGFGHGFDRDADGNTLRADRPAGHRVTDSPKAALATSGNDGKYADGADTRMGRGAGWRERKQNESFSAAVTDTVEHRNKRSVWRFPTAPFRGAHFATFPPGLVEPCLLAGCPAGGTVLDPFGGSGTVGLVADRYHRNAILIDLDERNAPMAAERITSPSPLLAQVEVGPAEQQGEPL